MLGTVASVPVPLLGVWWLSSLAQQGTDASLNTWLERLGVATVAVAIVLLWQRDTAKSRDRALSQLEAVQPLLIEVQHGQNRTIESHASVAEATKALIACLETLPKAEEVYRLRRALEDAERKLGA